jgi:hypothetical protein
LFSWSTPLIKRLTLLLIVLGCVPLWGQIGAVTLLGQYDSAPHAAYTTSDYTLPANHLALLVVRSTQAAGTPPVPTVESNHVGTINFVQVGTVVFGAASGARLTVFRAMASVDVINDFLTINFSGTQAACTWILDSVNSVATSGADGLGAVGAIATNSNNSGSGQPTTVAISETAGSGTWGTASLASLSVTTTAGSGMTLLGEVHSYRSIATEYAAGNVSPVQFNWSATSTAWATIAVELIPASGTSARRRQVVRID